MMDSDDNYSAGVISHQDRDVTYAIVGASVLILMIFAIVLIIFALATIEEATCPCKGIKTENSI